MDKIVADTAVFFVPVLQRAVFKFLELIVDHFKDDDCLTLQFKFLIVGDCFF